MKSRSSIAPFGTAGLMLQKVEFYLVLVLVLVRAPRWEGGY